MNPTTLRKTDLVCWFAVMGFVTQGALGQFGGGGGFEIPTLCSATVQCRAGGANKQRFPHPDGCKKYFECTGASRHERECPKDQTFHHGRQECTESDQCMVCPQDICGITVECPLTQILVKNYSHPANCQQYFQCEKSQLFLRDCPSKYKYDDQQNICKPQEEVNCEPCGPKTIPTRPPRPPTETPRPPITPAPGPVVTPVPGTPRPRPTRQPIATTTTTTVPDTTVRQPVTPAPETTRPRPTRQPIATTTTTTVLDITVRQPVNGNDSPSPPTTQDLTSTAGSGLDQTPSSTTSQETTTSKANLQTTSDSFQTTTRERSTETTTVTRRTFNKQTTESQPKATTTQSNQNIITKVPPPCPKRECNNEPDFEKRYPHPSNCSMYLECTANGLVGIACPLFMQFDSLLGACLSFAICQEPCSVDPTPQPPVPQTTAESNAPTTNSDITTPGSSSTTADKIEEKTTESNIVPNISTTGVPAGPKMTSQSDTDFVTQESVSNGIQITTTEKDTTTRVSVDRTTTNENLTAKVPDQNATTARSDSSSVVEVSDTSAASPTIPSTSGADPVNTQDVSMPSTAKTSPTTASTTMSPEPDKPTIPDPPATTTSENNGEMESTPRGSTTSTVTEEPQERILKHDLKPSKGEFLEGNNAVFQSFAILPMNILTERNFSRPEPRIEWRLKNTTVVDGGRGTIVTKDTFKKNETIISTLTIKRIKTTDFGELECLILDKNGLISKKTLFVSVLGRPTVTLDLDLALVEPGEYVSAQCTVEVPKTGSPDSMATPPPVYWYKDGVYVGMAESGRSFIGSLSEKDDEIDIISLTSGNSRLRLRVHKRMSLACSAHNKAGSSDIATKFINVYSPDAEPVYCEEDTVQGITWQRTLAGGEVFRDCKEIRPDTTGKARRECLQINDQVARWKAPEYSNCISEEFQNALEAIQRVESDLGGFDSQLLTETAGELEKLTIVKGNKPLLSGDIKVTVEIISTMASLREESQTEVPPEELEAVTKTISNILNDQNLESLVSLNDGSLKTSVNIMKSMDNYLAIIVQTVAPGKNKTIQTPNVVMMVESMLKSNLSTVKFPKKNTSSTVTDSWMISLAGYIMVEKQTLDSVKNNVPGPTVNVSAIVYRNLDKVLPTSKKSSTNSKVLAMTVHGLHRDVRLNPPVNMQFTLLNDYPDNMTNQCSFWNYTIPPRGDWSQVGCRTVSISGNTVTCECDHLTNFAMLVSPVRVPEKHRYILSMISLIGCIISIIALLLTIMFYGSMWSAVKSHHAAVLINLCVALMIGNALFIAGVDRTENKTVCTIVAALLHYFWLAAFFIMLVEGIQLLIYIIYVFHVRRKRDTIALLFGGWLFPAVIVGICLAATQLEGYGGDDACWLSIESGLLWGFVAPVLFVIAVNIVILIVVLKRSLSAKIPTGKKKNKLRSAVWNIVVMTPLLGITWILGVFSVNEDMVAFQYIFAISNSLQGLFIFIFHALCNKKKGRYALKETTTPSNQKNKTQSGSGQRMSNQHSTKSSKQNGKQNGVRNGYKSNDNTNSRRSTKTIDLHSAPLSRAGSYSSGTRPPLLQQLSDGSEVIVPMMDNVPRDLMERRTSPASTVPPSPTTTTTDVSWTSDKEILRQWSTSA